MSDRKEPWLVPMWDETIQQARNVAETLGEDIDVLVKSGDVLALHRRIEELKAEVTRLKEMEDGIKKFIALLDTKTD